MKRAGTATPLRVFEIFRAKREHMALRASVGSYEEYLRALQWMRDGGHPLAEVVRLAQSGEHPWRRDARAS